MNLQYSSRTKKRDRECGRLTSIFQSWVCTWKSVVQRVSENSINTGRRSTRKTVIVSFSYISTKKEKDGKVFY